MRIPPAAHALLADAYALMCFAHSHDLKARGQFLPPHTLPQLNAILAQPDPPPPRPWRAERETERVRLLHFLCAARGLLAPTGGLIKPTIALPTWLALPPPAQVAELFQAAYRASAATMAAAWRAYRFPGWRLVTPDTDLRPLWPWLRAQAGRRALALTHLAAALPITVLSDHPDAAPAALAHTLATHLAALGLATLSPSGRALRLTELGIAILSDQPSADADAPALVDAALEVDDHSFALRPAPASTLFGMCEVAHIAASMPLRFRLDRDLVKRALASGVTRDAIADLLSDALGGGLPSPITQSLRRWAREQARLTLRRTTVLEVKDPRLLQDLALRRAFRECIERTYSARAVAVRADRLPHLRRQLKRLGVEAAADGLAAKAPAAPLDPPTLAHLCVAARLVNGLAELVPLTYRLPHAQLARLEAQLSPEDRTAVQHAADAALDDLHRRQARARADVDARLALPEPEQPVELLLPEIEAAAKRGQALTIEYRAASGGYAGPRVIEPLRLEWWDGVAYLIAFCHHSQAERTFRVDRIMRASQPSRSSRFSR